MKKKTINVIIITGLFSILLLFIVQFFWAKNLVRLENKHFNHKVKIGLLNAGYKLKIIHHSKIDKIHLVKQLNENSFVVEVQDIVNPTTIDSLLQQEFKVQKLFSPYKIAIYDCFTDSVIYSHSGSEAESSVAAEEYGVDWDINSYNFGVIFPQINTLEKYLEIGLTSGVVILGIVGFFIYVVIMFMKQKKLDDMKTDFINNMTHELKTPISTISLSSNVINQPDIIQQPERLKRYAQIISQENERLKNQVERVLQLAFFEQINFQLNYKLLDIKSLVKNSIQPFKLILQEKSGSIEIYGDNLTAEVDEQHLGNTLSNLLDNAIKYSGEKKPILSVEIYKKEKKLGIKVKDNGIGMDKEELKNIFKKFYRAPTGNIHNVKGFGIGLSYVHQIVNMHQGTIQVSSKKNKGTVFEIILPLKQD
jgi:two-component system phosphate regulon sensor histidine kinase PhoR